MTMTRELSPSAQRRIGLAMLFLSACMLLFACYHAYGRWQLNQTGVLAQGEVISFSGKHNLNRVVRFQAPSGDIHVFKEQRGSVFSTSQQGDHVQVIFNPGHPDDAYIATTLWAGVWLLAGAVFFTGCMGVALLSRRPH
jgi:hypothetical protein